jgi:hypothetical protein
MCAGTALGLAYLVWLRDKRWLVVAPLVVVMLLLLNPVGVGQRIISIYHPAGDVDSNRFRTICCETGILMIKAHA